MKRFLWLLLLLPAIPLAAAADPAPAAPPTGVPVWSGSPKSALLAFPKADDPPKKDAKARPRGHKPSSPEVVAKRHADAFKRHGCRVKNLPAVTAASFDCRTMGWVLPVNDQRQCGDCFGISTIDACAMAFVKAGRLKNEEASRWSGQYGLDNANAFQGGCDGGDEAQVFDFARTNGFPLTSDYGPYTGNPARLKPVDASKLLKIADFGYCTPSQQNGVANTGDIKKAMVAYGPISVAFDAGECDSYRWPGTMTGRGGNVDHAVICMGWDDAHDNGDGSKGAFIGFNQWGNWGNNGAFWIKYGADSWGTEAIWVTAAPLPPPPTPPGPPVPPDPTPPGPGPVAGPLNGSIVTVETFVDGVSQGTVKSYLPAGTTGDLPALLKEYGINPIVFAADIAQLAKDIKAKAGFAVILGDLLKIAADFGQSATDSIPLPMPKEK